MDASFIANVTLAFAFSIGAVWHWWQMRKHKERIRRLQHEARHDPLTSLLNRRGFEEEARRIVAHHLRSGEPWAVLLLDLDGFKGVNDTFGHEAGDCVLRETARRLMCVLRTADIAARTGGDEFVMLLPGTGKEGVEKVRTRLSAALCVRIGLPQGGTVRVGASVGACVRHEAGKNDPARELAAALRAADEEMYRQKEKKK